MVWGALTTNGAHTDGFSAFCNHCDRRSYWVGTIRDEQGNYHAAILVYPTTVAAPKPHPKMPEAVKADFEEARNIAAQSPKAAAALLRLCVQELCIHFGMPGKNLNEDIGALVRNGLNTDIQQSLDAVRVIGNNAVHPGEISGEDVAGVTASLFDLVNFIVEDRIARPDKIKDIYANLPKAARDQIEKRDGKK